MNRNKIMAVLFVACIALISMVSDYKLMNFYINGEIDYNEWNAATDTKLETDYISNFWLKYQYVNFNGAFRHLLGQHEMNGVIKLNNGYLHSPLPYISDDAVNRYAYQTYQFQQLLAERNIDYVYFSTPCVVDKYDPQMPVGVTGDYGNDSVDRLVAAFNANGVNNVDLRETLHNAGLSTYDIFYHTDHHWTTLGGFWGYNQIVDYIEQVEGVVVDPMVRDLNNYEITTYENWHLGSHGQRVGIYYAGIDDFNLILPRFDTYIEKVHAGIAGTMQEMMIYMAPLQQSNYMSRYTYDSVMGGSCDYWHNPNASCNLRVLVIGDSMTKVVMPYLALSFTDVAFGAAFDNAISVNSALIDSYQPDIVISIVHPGHLGDSTFNWGLVQEQG